MKLGLLGVLFVGLLAAVIYAGPSHYNPSNEGISAPVLNPVDGGADPAFCPGRRGRFLNPGGGGGGNPT